MKVLLRVDGDREAGMGHIVRTRALGRALAERGASVFFVTVSEEGGSWLRGRGEDVEQIAEAAGGGGDANAVARLAWERGVAWVVTDGYAFRDEYLEALVRAGARVASVDDLAAWFFPSALVVNGGPGSRGLRYRTSPSTRLLLGPEYLLLRPEFRRASAEVRPTVERAFVCFGGSDLEDWTGFVLELWSGLERPPVLEVLVGAAYSGLGGLRPKAARMGARIHCDLEGGATADLMRTCDVAIASAGMVACELAALGVPAILVCASEDQRGNAEAFRAAGAAVLVDPYRPDSVAEAVATLRADGERRRAMSLAARRLVDGLGTSRVASAMVEGG